MADTLRKFYENSARPYVVVAAPCESYVEFEIYEDNFDLNPLFAGSIKWDGCSNWDFSQHHFCSMEEIIEFGKLLEELYLWAAELLPKWKKMILDEEGAWGKLVRVAY